MGASMSSTTVLDSSMVVSCAGVGNEEGAKGVVVALCIALAAAGSRMSNLANRTKSLPPHHYYNTSLDFRTPK